MANSLTHAVKTNIRIELLRQERAYLVALRTRMHAVAHRREAIDKLAQLRQAHVKVYGEYQSVLKRRNAFEANGGLGVHIPYTPAHKELQRLSRQVSDLWIVNDHAYKDFLAQQAVLNTLPSPRALPTFAADVQRLTSAAEPLRERLLRARNLAAELPLASLAGGTSFAACGVRRAGRGSLDNSKSWSV
jgi:hypothetical protein